MPSWNEKPVVVPAINVNLKTCNCPQSKRLSGLHDIDCASVPVRVPCPLPRSVTVMVRLGECNCSPRRDLLPGGGVYLDHSPSCESHPIRVSCSISGEWEESKVTNVDIATTGRFMGWDEEGRCIEACRERWALVKALVLHDVIPARPWSPDRIAVLADQRTAVYAAICEMARDEEKRIATKRSLHAACSAIFPKSGVSVPDPATRESAAYLAAYIKHLVEQVGALS